MIGRIAAALIVLAAVIGGGAIYYLQVYAYYERVEGGALGLTPRGGGAPATVPAEGLSAIDADSSPLRYRACFEHALDAGDWEPYPGPEPTIGPGWFGCYDAGEAAGAIASGEAAAVTGTANITYGVDRVVALWPRRGVAWHQLNACGEAVYGGREPPAGCPTPPEAYRD